MTRVIRTIPSSHHENGPDYVVEEGPAEHVKNALAILAVATVDARDHRELTPQEYAAICRRLRYAVQQLERGQCGIRHGLPASINEALNTGDGTYKP